MSSLDLELCLLESRGALLEQLFAPTEERDRVVDGHVASLEARDDLLQLARQLFEASGLAHGTPRRPARRGSRRRARCRRDRRRGHRGGVAQRAATRADDRVAATERRQGGQRLQARAGGRVQSDDVRAAGVALLEAAHPVARACRGRARAAREPRARAVAYSRAALTRARRGPARRAPSRRRSRRARVGGEVAQRCVLLVADRRDDRYAGAGDGANDGLVAEREGGLRSCRLARASTMHVDLGMCSRVRRAPPRSPSRRLCPALAPRGSRPSSPGTARRSSRPDRRGQRRRRQ